MYDEYSGVNRYSRLLMTLNKQWFFKHNQRVMYIVSTEDKSISVEIMLPFTSHGYAFSHLKSKNGNEIIVIKSRLLGAVRQEVFFGFIEVYI